MMVKRLCVHRPDKCYVIRAGADARQWLAAPLGNTLFFAGEATSVGHVGTVHGAIQSGQRAGEEILAHDR